MDIKQYDNFEEFFIWYVNIIKTHVPDYLLIPSAETHKKLPKLTSKEVNEVSKRIRIIQKMPPKVTLIYSPDMWTFFSRYNKSLNRVEMGFPTVTKYMLSFPTILRVVIQHEIGHIINGDIIADVKEDEGRETNICMDCRINQNLDYDTLDKINRCLFTFASKKTNLIVPEELFPEIGLPLEYKNVVTWQKILENYLLFKRKYAPSYMPQVGDFVELLKEINSFPIKTMGVITNILDTPPEDIFYEVHKISDDMKKAIDDDDFASFTDIMQAHDFTLDKIGDKLIYNNKDKDFEVVPKPQNPEKVPQVGSFVIMLKELPESITDLSKSATQGIYEADYGIIAQIGEHGGKPLYTILRLNDRLSEAIDNGNPDRFMELLMMGIISDGKRGEGFYLEHFALIDVPKKPTDEPPPPPPPQKDKSPQVGDVIMITKEGNDKNKYGIIKSINGGYEVDEISYQVAKKMLKKT